MRDHRPARQRANMHIDTFGLFMKCRHVVILVSNVSQACSRKVKGSFICNSNASYTRNYHSISGGKSKEIWAIVLKPDGFQEGKRSLWTKSRCSHFQIPPFHVYLHIRLGLKVSPLLSLPLPFPPRPTSKSSLMDVFTPCFVFFLVMHTHACTLLPGFYVSCVAPSALITLRSVSSKQKHNELVVEE